MKTKLLNLLFVCMCTFAYSQQIEISGTVISSEDNFPIAGANILIEGTNSGTSTDFDGNYTISVTNGATIIVSYIGFTTKKIQVGDQQKINITLEPDNQQLDEIVVVGYGTQKKKEVTGAVSVIDSKVIDKLNPVQAEQALQGQVAGVNVTSNSGAPGASANIRIRGISTNGDNRPLILVDGNVIEDLSVLNPNDIESFNVLKDATAAIYGVRASNGVILITTKSGKRNTELKFKFDSYTGFQETTKNINVLNATEYGLIVNESELAGGNPPIYDNIKDLGYGTDWQKEVFRVAPISNINFSGRGGTEKSSYGFGVGYLDQDGIVGGPKANYNRLTLRANYERDIIKNLKANASVIYTHSNRNKLNENALGSVLFNAVNMNPTLPVKMQDGSYSIAEGLGAEVINPLHQLENTYDTDRINRISSVVGLTYKFFKDFEISSKFQHNYSKVDTKVFRPIANYGSGKVFNIDRNDVREDQSKYEDYTWDNFITYKKSFNDAHNVTALVGMSVFKTTGVFESYTGYDIPGNSYENASIENASEVIDNKAQEKLRGANTFDVRLLSYFTRLQYNYKEKYIFSAMVRRDGSTRFGPENRFGYFPSASLGWVATEENFLRDNSWLNFLKVRASYGVIGSDRIGDYRYLSTLGGEATYASEGELIYGLAEGGLANPSIQWEEQKTANFGIDANLFNNEVNITMDVFNKRTNNLLLSAQVSGLLGAEAPGSSAPTINAGTVDNRGFEFLIGYNKNFTEDFRFNASYNFTTLKNEVIFVAGQNGFEQGGAFGVGLEPPSRMEAGYPIGYFYGYKTDGVFQTQEEIDNSATTSTATAPGDLKYVDINGDGKIDLDDRTNIGSHIPTLTMGLNLGFNYKNIDFSSSLFASMGNEIVRNYERNQPLVNKSNHILSRWTGPGTSNSTPRVTSGSSPNFLFSDYFVEDGDFLRIQNVQVGYTLPYGLTEQVGIDKFRIYGSVNNLYTFTKYRGFDPSATTGAPIGGGIDQGFYPIPRTFLLGLNVNF